MIPERKPRSFLDPIVLWRLAALPPAWATASAHHPVQVAANSATITSILGMQLPRV